MEVRIHIMFAQWVNSAIHLAVEPSECSFRVTMSFFAACTDFLELVVNDKIIILYKYTNS